jgi:hypothetical protein
MRRNRIPASFAALLLLAACGGGSGGTAEWGPLAVVEDEGTAGGQESGGTGTLRIDDGCVTFEQEGGRELTPVWPSGLTRWDASGRAIVFDVGRRSVRLVDGDLITIGGSGEVHSEFVAPPADTCPEARFLVYEVRTER